MEAWLKHNLISLLIVVGSLVGVYTALKTSQAAASVDIVALQLHVEKLDKSVAEIPALKKDVEHLEGEVDELKPILAELSKGVQSLNVTLAKIEGKIGM